MARGSQGMPRGPNRRSGRRPRSGRAGCAFAAVIVAGGFISLALFAMLI